MAVLNEFAYAFLQSKFVHEFCKPNFKLLETKTCITNCMDIMKIRFHADYIGNVLWKNIYFSEEDYAFLSEYVIQVTCW